MLRLFIAWPLPETVSREIARKTGPLRTALPPASWPRPESLHLTFAFLGDTPDDRVAALSAALDACGEASAIPVRAAGVGVFPDERRPRVAWIGVEPAAPVVELAANIRHALTAAGASFDPKPFRPHLTIARIKVPWRAADVGALRDAFRDWRSPDATIDRIVLYASRLSPHGAVHSEVHAVALGMPVDRSQ
ncbi:MAG TPA: RNA 2',3'-cyclic phosphodiesterase [Thermoanaerobaculia bacterium]|nr:RNA 2',3'-cyclic phosphodiesterase [Thermoanaerobaculia bacterium]